MSSNNKELLARELNQVELDLKFLNKWQLDGKTLADYIKLMESQATILKLKIDREG